LWFGFPVWRSWRMRGGIYREATTAGVEVERSKGRRRPTTWREGGSEGTRRTAGESGVGVLERWMVRSRCLAAVPACQHAQRRRRAQVFFSMLVCPPCVAKSPWRVPRCKLDRAFGGKNKMNSQLPLKGKIIISVPTFTLILHRVSSSFSRKKSSLFKFHNNQFNSSTFALFEHVVS
jgi:hypothetical protein